MHDGSFHELDTAVRVYNGGVAVGRPRGAHTENPAFPAQSPLIRELDLTEAEVQDIVAFLRSLDERRVVRQPPDLPGIEPPVRQPAGRTFDD